MTDHISWDQYFMAVADISALRSKDPSTKVGACISNQDNKIVGVGYNGMPKGIDTIFPWTREGENQLLTKYPFVVHAEQNAILNSIKNLKGCTIYVSLFPCSECAKSIVQSGIRKVVYQSDKYNGTIDNIASKAILKTCGVRTKQINDHIEVFRNGQKSN